MTRPRRTAAAARSGPVEPVAEVPGYCRGLDLLTDADVRVPSQWSIGPSDMLLTDGHVAMVRPAGPALQLLDSAGECRGVFASWVTARASLLVPALEYEATLDPNAV